MRYHIAMEVFVILLAYLIGSIPTAYLIVKKKSGKDIRQIGSKNMGATNVFKSLGGRYGMAVFFIDFLKGIAALAVPVYLFDLPMFVVIAAGATAVIGHNYPVWIGFKGGKGAAAAAGVFVLYSLSQSLFWPLAIFVAIIIVGYLLYKNVVVGACAAFVIMPFVFFLSGQSQSGWFTLLLLFIIAVKFIPSAWNDICSFMKKRLKK